MNLGLAKGRAERGGLSRFNALTANSRYLPQRLATSAADRDWRPRQSSRRNRPRSPGPPSNSLSRQTLGPGATTELCWLRARIRRKTSGEDHMGARTDFEIRQTEQGFFVFSRTQWWNENQKVNRVPAVSGSGGLVRVEPFASSEAAIDWVYEQFSVPTDSWQSSDAGSLVSGKGDPAPKSPTSAPLLPPDLREDSLRIAGDGATRKASRRSPSAGSHYPKTAPRRSGR